MATVYDVFPHHLLAQGLPYNTLVAVVTHADYKALEDKCARLEEVLRVTNMAWRASEEFNDVFDQHKYGYGEATLEDVDKARMVMDAHMKELANLNINSGTYHSRSED